MRDYIQFCRVVIGVLSARFEGAEEMVGLKMDFDSIQQDLLELDPESDTLTFNMSVVLIESGLFENRVCSTNPIAVWNPLKTDYRSFISKYPSSMGFPDDVSKPDLREVNSWLEDLSNAPLA